MAKKSFDILSYVNRPADKFVQLVLDIAKVKPEKLPKGVLMVSEKIDGVFAIGVLQDREVHIYSRTGKPYVSLEHLKPDLWAVAKATETDVILFEARADGVPQSTTSGWCRDTKKQHYEVDAYVHDCLTMDEFCGDCVSDSYEERYKRLTKCQDLFTGSGHVFLLPNFYHDTWQSIDKMVQQIWAQGGEGVVIRVPEAPYQIGLRNETMIKMKRGLSYDLEVVGMTEGTNRLSGTLGTLQCRWKDGGVVNVGSGLTDAQRQLWWTQRDLIVGKVVQVDAMTFSSKGSLREPVFKGVRDDKVKADY